MTLLLCQTEPYRERCRARVVSCKPAGKRFRVVLEETVLYPEGGGQPADRGTIGGVRVVDVQKDAEAGAVHLVEKPFAAGVEVEVAVDWRRRFDHMQQHTAQHLLTALAIDRWGAKTIGFHLGADVSWIELDTEKFTAERAAELEERANAEIRAARTVRHRVIEPDEMAALGVRSRGLPEGHSGPVRLIEIEGIDLNTCGGTHVASTAELQVIRVAGVERARGNCRVIYLAGGRVLDWIAVAAEREARLQEVLTAGPDEQVACVEKLSSEAIELGRRLKRVEAELAELLGREIAAEEGPVVVRHRPNDEPGFLSAVAHRVVDRRPDLLLLLTCGEGDEGFFLLAGPQERVSELGPKLAAALDGRGGGPPGRFQGKSRRVAQAESALRELAGDP